MTSTAALAALLAAVAVLATGCRVIPDGRARQVDATAPPGGAGRDGSSASRGPSAGARTRPAQEAALRFDMPTGFRESTDYRIAVPLYDGGKGRWLIPTGTYGLDVIAVTAYVMNDDTTGLGSEELVTRINAYAAKVHATSASKPVLTVVAGYPAWQQDMVQPGASNGGSFTYQATFVFAGWHLVQVMCQYDKAKDRIMQGCRTVLDTLRVEDA